MSERLYPLASGFAMTLNILVSAKRRARCSLPAHEAGGQEAEELVRDGPAGTVPGGALERRDGSRPQGWLPTGYCPGAGASLPPVATLCVSPGGALAGGRAPSDPRNGNGAS